MSIKSGLQLTIGLVVVAAISVTDRAVTVAQDPARTNASQAQSRSNDRTYDETGPAEPSNRAAQTEGSDTRNRSQERRQRGERDRQRNAHDAWLGVLFQADEGNSGARVAKVFPTSPAARAGLRRGDLIVEFNGQEITESSDVVSAMAGIEPGNRAEMTVRRHGQEMTFSPMLGRRDPFVYLNPYEHYERGGDHEHDAFSNFPPLSMQMEHDRRNTEQHQRIETEIRKLKEEVRKLRELLEQRE